MNYFFEDSAGNVLNHVMAAGRALKETALPAAVRELVALRVRQINGCAACIDMHTKDATAAGEDAVRLHLVAAWPEATVFTEAERAALALAEQGTRTADAATGVDDEVWQQASLHYDTQQLTALALLISFMNMANRLKVITRQPGGGYKAGQFH